MGSGRDRALLVRFMHLTYQELFPQQQNFSHLAKTVERYLSTATPLWWVETESSSQKITTVATLWLGTVIDQVRGERYAHIFLIFVRPEHRRQGIGRGLMQIAEDWAKARGDRQIGLQVFISNQPALNLYQRLGYDSQSLSMIKSLSKK
ncbi:GNAT family N-acetyltransferase [Pleurocapsales cyanobacterium LEGE 06147]|nr:GNAT family N-acetyltransferase [Pleurocapsales cyanobacterium LEGE 06147]